MESFLWTGHAVYLSVPVQRDFSSPFPLQPSSSPAATSCHGHRVKDVRNNLWTLPSWSNGVTFVFPTTQITFFTTRKRERELFVIWRAHGAHQIGRGGWGGGMGSHGRELLGRPWERASSADISRQSLQLFMWTYRVIIFYFVIFEPFIFGDTKSIVNMKNLDLLSHYAEK